METLSLLVCSGASLPARGSCPFEELMGWLFVAMWELTGPDLHPEDHRMHAVTFCGPIFMSVEATDKWTVPELITWKRNTALRAGEYVHTA